jgi:putative transposase
MHNTLANAKTLRTLNTIDDFNREVLSITVDTSLPSQRVVRELETLAEWHGRPDTIRSDNGPEFISEALSQWCKKSGIEWVFIQPGKPTLNSLIERFNRTYRQDVLDSYMFESLTELRKYSQAWAWMYNNERPHAALGYLTPVEFLLKYGKLTPLNQSQLPT